MPYGAVTGSNIFVNTLGAEDTLTIDYSLGSFAAPGKTIQFNGMSGSDNILNVTGAGTFSQESFNNTGAQSGSVQVTDAVGMSTVDYANLSVVNSTITATNVALNLPVNAQASLHDESNSSSGISEITSLASGFATATFADPAGTFTVNAAGNSLVQLGAMDSDFAPAIEHLRGQSGKNGGVFELTAANAVPSATSLALSATTFDLNGNDDTVGGLRGNGFILNNGDSPATLTLANSSGNQTFAGVLANGTGGLALSMDGTGSQTLSGISTYTGATTVNSGELIVDGTLTSPISVAAGGTLSGENGTLADSVSVDGALTAGDSNSQTGVLNLSSDLAFTSPGSYNVQLSGTTAGSEYDQIIDSRAVDLAGAFLNVSLGFTPAIGDSFDILVNKGDSEVTGYFTLPANSAESLPAQPLTEGYIFNVSGVNFQITYQGGYSGHDVVLKVVADPAMSSGTLNAAGGVAQATATNLSAAFTDANPLAPASEFSGTINWGDGTAGDPDVTPFKNDAVSGSDGSYIVSDSHQYAETGQYSIKVTIDDVGGGSTIDSGTTLVLGYTPTVNVTDSGGTYNEADPTPFPATATMTAFDGTTASSLDGISPTFAYYAGTSTVPLADVPTYPGSYTVVATYPGSPHYASASDSVTFTITAAPLPFQTPQNETNTNLFNQNTVYAGTTSQVNLTDGSVMATVTDNASNSASPPVTVTVAQYVPSSTQAVVTIGTGTSQTVAAQYDLNVIGDSNAIQQVSITIEFLIPSTDTNPILEFGVPAEPVPMSQVSITTIGANTYFALTVSASTPVNVSDLTGTVFTITDAGSLPSFLNVLTTLTAAPQTPAANTDVLGDLLSTSESTASTPLISVIAPTNVSQVTNVGYGGLDAESSESRAVLQFLDALFRQLQQFFRTQMQLLTEGWIVSMQTSNLSPPEAAPTPIAPPAPAPEPLLEACEGFIPENELVRCEPQNLQSGETESMPNLSGSIGDDAAGNADPAADAYFFARRAPGIWDAIAAHPFLSCAAMAAAPFLPWLNPMMNEELDRRRMNMNFNHG